MVLNELNPTSCKVYSLSWSEFSSSLSATAQNLRNAEDLTDVTISAGGKIFPAHKLVLSAASPLLMELLKNTKCQHPILMLAGISANDLEIILDFVYRGEINIDSEKLPSLLQAAQFLDIRALSPTALVLHSVENNALPIPATISKDINTFESRSIMNEDCNKISNSCPPLKRKIVPKQTKTHNSKVIRTPSHSNAGDTLIHKNKINADEADVTLPPTISQSLVTDDLIPAKPNDTDNQEGITGSSFEEKKIISDLPVKCKLCGVIIRQSRNLRRHIDQMHSKTKFKTKKTSNRKEKQAPINGDVPAKSSPDTLQSVDGADSSLVDDFSQDSFSQLTEEILNYSAGSESDESSFSNTITISSTSMNACLLENTIHNSHRSPSACSTSSQTLPTLLEDEICFQLSAKSDGNSTVSSNIPAKVETSSAEEEQFGCPNLDDSCHVNVIALKELENQLFSACFCSTENI